MQKGISPSRNTLVLHGPIITQDNSICQMFLAEFSAEKSSVKCFILSIFLQISLSPLVLFSILPRFSLYSVCVSQHLYSVSVLQHRRFTPACFCLFPCTDQNKAQKKHRCSHPSGKNKTASGRKHIIISLEINENNNRRNPVGHIAAKPCRKGNSCSGIHFFKNLSQPQLFFLVQKKHIAQASQRQKDYSIQ